MTTKGECLFRGVHARCERNSIDCTGGSVFNVRLCYMVVDVLS